MPDIAKRTAIAIALPLAGSLVLALLLGLQWREDLQRVQRVDRMTELIVGISAVVSALQDERGATATALSGVPGFARMLPELRRETDIRVRELGRLFEPLERGQATDALVTQLRIVRAALAELPALRERADRNTTVPLASIDAYTGMVRLLSETVASLGLEISVPGLAERIAAYRRLLVFIEYSARERSLGAALLGSKGADETYHRTFVNNLTAQGAMLQQLREAPAGSSDRELYRIVAASPHAAEMEVFRRRLADAPQLTQPDPQAALEWFGLASAYIVDLEATLERWAGELSATGAQLSSRAVAYYAALGAGLLLLLGTLAWVSVALGRRLIWQMAAERHDSERIRFLGRHDPLTALPNRHYFEELLAAEQRATMDSKGMLALHLFDIVDFKEINRIWGIAAGDAVIRAAAERLRERLPVGGQLARLYADQFGLLQPGIAGKEAAEALARRLIAAFAEPVRVEERSIPLHIRVGITLYPPNATTYDALVRNADLARQHVVEGGGYTFYVSEMYQRYLASKVLARDLRRAVDAGEFRLVYQPKMDLTTRRLCGMEALIRWQHPEQGLLEPGRFIAEAERSGLIVSIGAWVFNETCRQLRAWAEAGLKQPVVAINLSAVQLRQADLVRHFADAIGRCQVDPTRLEVEVTETALIGDFEGTLATLEQLRSLGVSLAIDDFGTGYSSLAYLQRLPANRVKLDRSFISELETSPQTVRIVEAVITLSHGLGLRVVAEGVENEAQLETLREKGCDEVQGYWLSKPLAADEMAGWLDAKPGSGSSRS